MNFKLSSQSVFCFVVLSLVLCSSAVAHGDEQQDEHADIPQQLEQGVESEISLPDELEQKNEEFIKTEQNYLKRDDIEITIVTPDKEDVTASVNYQGKHSFNVGLYRHMFPYLSRKTMLSKKEVDPKKNFIFPFNFTVQDLMEDIYAMVSNKRELFNSNVELRKVRVTLKGIDYTWNCSRVISMRRSETQCIPVKGKNLLELNGTSYLNLISISMNARTGRLKSKSGEAYKYFKQEKLLEKLKSYIPEEVLQLAKNNSLTSKPAAKSPFPAVVEAVPTNKKNRTEIEEQKKLRKQRDENEKLKKQNVPVQLKVKNEELKKEEL